MVFTSRAAARSYRGVGLVGSAGLADLSFPAMIFSFSLPYGLVLRLQLQWGPSQMRALHSNENSLF